MTPAEGWSTRIEPLTGLPAASNGRTETFEVDSSTQATRKRPSSPRATAGSRSVLPLSLTRSGPPAAAPDASKRCAQMSPVPWSNQTATVMPEAFAATWRPPPASETRCVPGAGGLTATSGPPLDGTSIASTPA